MIKLTTSDVYISGIEQMGRNEQGDGFSYKDGSPVMAVTYQEPGDPDPRQVRSMKIEQGLDLKLSPGDIAQLDISAEMVAKAVMGQNGPYVTYREKFTVIGARKVGTAKASGLAT